MEALEGKTVADVKKSVTAHRGHRTRAVKQIQQLVGMMQAAPSDLVRKELMDTVQKLREQVDALIICYDYMISIDDTPADVVTWTCLLYTSDAADE